jgi:hypothetical protein
MELIKNLPTIFLSSHCITCLTPGYVACRDEPFVPVQPYSKYVLAAFSRGYTVQLLSINGLLETSSEAFFAFKYDEADSSVAFECYNRSFSSYSLAGLYIDEMVRHSASRKMSGRSF